MHDSGQSPGSSRPLPWQTGACKRPEPGQHLGGLAYRGRFAPSPTGPLHPGSLVAAMASWLDARAHRGTWLVRIEDLDAPRTVPGAAEEILATLRDYGMHWDGDVVWQSQRIMLYQDAFDRLRATGLVYPCCCSRREVADSANLASPGADGAPVYPGTCRYRAMPEDRTRAWRLRVDMPATAHIDFVDRLFGQRTQYLPTAVGDFVLKRADGQWAYQLAVVVDDADQSITHIVRGADLIDSTPRQILLQRLLGLPTPRYLHVPVVTDATGAKLSKQTGAQALDRNRPLPALQQAARHLGLPDISARSQEDFWRQAVPLWANSLANREQCRAAIPDGGSDPHPPISISNWSDSCQNKTQAP